MSVEQLTVPHCCSGRNTHNRIESLTHEFMLVTNLTSKDLSNEVTRFFYFRQGEFAVYLSAVAVGANDTGSLKDGQVLRKVRSRQS